MRQDTPIITYVNVFDGLSVQVSRTVIGTFRTVFRDTDADAVIESRVWTNQARAEEYAMRLAKPDARQDA
jgi:hypothetical protein